LVFAPSFQAHSKTSCRYVKSLSGLSGYDRGGPYTTDHFRLTKGRTDLREFLWTHWHEHKKGVAEERGGTVDRGTVKVLYIVQPTYRSDVKKACLNVTRAGLPPSCDGRDFG
jgi:hypothetical protein